MSPDSYRNIGTTRKHRDKTVIAHISDLHCTSASQFEADPRWLALGQDLKRNSPDILVVTGDLIDGSISDSNDLGKLQTAFSGARRFLSDNLCKEAQIEPAGALLVVPGNHDFRVKGNFFRKPMFDLFYQEFKAYFQPTILSGLKLIVFVFDSNPREFGIDLATGLVAERDLIEFSARAEALADGQADLWYSSTRIALLHHHPMPIAATEHRERMTDKEEFLLLKNAGLFMNEMVRSQIDLVLHGHKHHPSFSRASFPGANAKEHPIAVVGAGSVGKGDLSSRSYNLITIHESGEINLERRDCPAATYEGAPTVALRHYEDARWILAARSAARVGSKLRVKRYTRLDMIQAGSGDDNIQEDFEAVQSYSGESVSEIEYTISSKSGRFPERVYETDDPQQRFSWNWLGPASPDCERRGITRFDPPITLRPVSYRRKGPIPNAVYFNQKDRLDATERESSQEDVSTTVMQWNDLLVFQVHFPDGFFPSKFNLEVTSKGGRREYREESFAHKFFSVVSQLRTATLALQCPIPGFAYRIVWELPANENDELSLNSAQKLHAEAIIERLFDLRRPDSRYQPRAHEALRVLYNQVVESEIFKSQNGDDKLEVSLFVYDPSSAGLVYVAGVGRTYAADSRIWSWVIKTGTFVAGQAYKRRSDLTWVRSGSFNNENGPYESFDEDEEPHTVVTCMPMFYPSQLGRRVAVLSLASRSKTSGLLRLDGNNAAKLALKAQSIVWFGTSLMAALDMPRIL